MYAVITYFQNSKIWPFHIMRQTLKYMYMLWLDICFQPNEYIKKIQ